MGSGFGWRCKSCGAEELFMTGSGMMSLNVPETRERIARGEFGEIARHLLSDGFPVNVDTIDLREVYRCSLCGQLAEGMSVLFMSEEDASKLKQCVPPEVCPGCGEEFEPDGPVSDAELYERFKSVSEEGCPECGSKEIEPLMEMWD